MACVVNPGLIPLVMNAVVDAYYYVGAAVTTASYYASQALGGKEAVVSNVQKMENARNLGKQGEQAANIVKNTERIASASKTASYRIPDGLDKTNKILTEVKNVKSLGLTNQLKDFSRYAVDNGFSFVLKTRPSTVISAPLQGYIDSGKIIHLFIGN